MKTTYLTLAGIILTATLFTLTSTASAKVEYLKGTADNVNYQVLKVPMDGSAKITIAAVPSPGTPLSLKDFILQKGGTHAINGAFFCPAGYKRCEPNTSDQLRITEGVLLSKWGTDVADGQAVFGFDKEGIPSMVVGRSSEGGSKGGRFWDQSVHQRNHPDLKNIHNGIMMYTLVINGTNVGIHNTKMNTDAKQKKATNKSFLCSTQDKKTVYMGYVDKQTFSSLPDYIIKHFGCHEAIMLDNGGTRAMIVNKEYVAGPGRNMMDAVIVTENQTPDTITPKEKEEKAEKTEKADTATTESLTNPKILQIHNLFTTYFSQKNFTFNEKKAFIDQIYTTFNTAFKTKTPSDPYFETYQLLIKAISTFPLK